MDEQELMAWAEEVALQCPGAELEHPFGPETDVFKVRGRMFLMRLELRGQWMVNLKVEPQDGQALRDEFAEITPGYHMNKRHWVSVRAGEALSRRFVRELVVDSYRLVLEKLPRSVRPVDPETYGG
ncbi:MmcQ/YjbR family DNA-binding protein [Kocuria palustris]|uniref:MmcQ/YjbR family DNA-binding protein n=1 Tax=Kocuria palustris TaxID=71999 RepID=UPI002468B7FE|nr:MmcQ/YjbR family DNA-binding protein [Kocuria palustris]MDH5151003.1 MmcQ/YjbR family DNA-binding protein [Kocuria palustris]